MSVLSYIKTEIKKNNKLYMILLCIRYRNDPNLFNLIKGYRINQNEHISLLISHKNAKCGDKLIYHIKYPDDRSGNTKKAFCATLRVTLDRLLFAEHYGLIPVVEWGEQLTFYDSEMDKVTKNVFDYYFEPVSGINYGEIDNFSDVVIANDLQGCFLIEHPYGYELQQNEIERLGKIYKKYICLNKNTQEYIDKNINRIMNNGRILGVHARGTDFKKGFKNHPKVISSDMYIENARALFETGNYDKIFIATEDINILNSFIGAFKDKLLYYDDVFRASGDIGPHSTESNRPLHHYKLGLEVLRDVYTLAHCDGLVCGLSQVSFAARYVNIALGRKFDEVIVLNNGINMADSK